MWQDSEQVNCGYTTFVKNGFNSYYVVCQYYPPGNYVGEYAENVAPLTSSSEDDDSSGDGDNSSGGNSGAYHITAAISLLVGAVLFLVA